MARLIPLLLRALPKSPLRRIDRFLARPAETQDLLLRDLLRRAADTEWGRRFDFAGLLRRSDVAAAYRERVPIHGYEDIRPDVERVRAGEADVLWPGTVRYFAASSGTTSSGRIIPVTDEMAEMDQLFSLGTGFRYIEHTGRTGFLFGRHLTLPGWIEADRRPGTRLGQISAVLSETAPAPVKLLWRAVPDRLGFIENWEEKMAVIADHVVEQDIRLCVFAPSWGLVLFRAVIERYNRRHGTSHTTLAEIWPNLQVIITGGVALDSYRAILSELVGRPEVDLVETYGASEGFFSFQDDLADPAMLLHLDCGVYLEYVRLEELGQDHPRRYTIGEVEPGVRYAPVLSTVSGLWAYLVGDVVRFTQTDPHKIVVAGRTVEMLDKYGEAVFGEEAHEALQQACTDTGVHALNYHVTHVPTGTGRIPAHQWLIEFEDRPADLQAFARLLDERLKQAGHHYDDRREGMAFDRPEVVALPRGAFHQWLEHSGKRVTMQTKIPRMNEERTVADAVLALVEPLERVQ